MDKLLEFCLTYGIDMRIDYRYSSRPNVLVFIFRKFDTSEDYSKHVPMIEMAYLIDSSLIYNQIIEELIKEWGLHT